MSARLGLIGLALLFIALPVLASCAQPTISISSELDRFWIDGSMDVNLVFSANPSPMTTCKCLVGADCGMEWQTDNNGTWNRIPRNTNVDIDLNCSGTLCSTGVGYPTEDAIYTRTITCLDQNVYRIRGYQAYTNTTSQVITVYCYPLQECTPPARGNFDLNTTCNFSGVPILVDRNYTIYSNGHAIHSNADINFTNTTKTQYVRIQNGGQLNLNHSGFIYGLTQNGPITGGIIFLIILGIGAAWISQTKKWKTETTT